MKPNWKQGMKNHARSISTSNSNTAANSLKNITDKVTITPVLGTGTRNATEMVQQQQTPVHASQPHS